MKPTIAIEKFEWIGIILVFFCSFAIFYSDAASMLFFCLFAAFLTTALTAASYFILKWFFLAIK